MRILHLLRQSKGGMWRAATHLAKALRDRSAEVELVDASSFIPAETGPKFDKAVTSELRSIGAEYDLVHAWGYRAAWACGDAYGDREAWVYTAYDVPKSTHRLLLSHLNSAQAGFCSSRAVYRKLDEALALDLEILHLGIGPIEMAWSKAEARDVYKLPENGLVVGTVARFVEERGIESLLAAVPKALDKFPDLTIVIAGEGPLKEALVSRTKELAIDHAVRWEPWQEDPVGLFRAMDLLVVPSTRAGFSMAAVEAMAVGTPVLLRDTGGLREIVDTDISGFLFQDEDQLSEQLVELLGLPLTLESVGHGAKIRALDHFSIDRVADRVFETYERLIEG